MLTLLVLLQNLRWMVPTTLMMGAAPGYLTAWAAWRAMSLCLPNWVYVKGDDFLFTTYQRHVLFCFETLTGVQVKIYGDFEAVKYLRKGENAIYISNHQCTADWVVAESLALRRGSLGRVRFVLKDGLRFLPFYGFYLGMHGSLFVKRAGKFNDAKANAFLARCNKDKKPMWFVLFPEGTRINPELPTTIAKSQQFSKDQGLEPLEYVLHPRMRAMQSLVQQLQDSVDCVYDVTVAYSNTFDPETNKRKESPTMQDFLMAKTKQLHLHVTRIPIANVPVDENELKSWLFSRYQEKDKLLRHFYSCENSEQAKFPGESQENYLPLYSVLPSFLFWSSTVVTCHLLKENRELYWKIGSMVACTGMVWMAVRH